MLFSFKKITIFLLLINKINSNYKIKSLKLFSSSLSSSFSSSSLTTSLNNKQIKRNSLINYNKQQLLFFSSILNKQYNNENEAKEILLCLNNEIKKYDDFYYNNGESIISDYDYDQLVHKGNEIITKYKQLQPFFDKYYTVGSPIPLKSAEFSSYNHQLPMLSLENTFDQNGIEKFVSDAQVSCIKNNLDYKSLNFTTEPKIDGVSLSIKYINGKLVQAGTRGDGFIGEDITRHITAILNIPSKINLNHKNLINYVNNNNNDNINNINNNGNNIEIEIRGEVYMTNNDFQKLKNSAIEQGKTTQFSSPRNTVAGALRSLSTTEIQRHLRFIAYSLYIKNNSNINSTYQLLPTQSLSLNTLTQLGFTVPTNWKLINIVINNDKLIIDKLFQICKESENNRNNLDYDTDGVVIKVDNVHLQELLGFRPRSPKWAIAYKFTPKSSITKLLKIDVQVGRTGVLTPVAILSPVKIGGVTIERATLHNYQEIKRLGIKPGSWVRVQRSGDVIPKIVECVESPSIEENNNNVDVLNRIKNHEDDKNFNEDEICFQIPDKCPVCSSPVIVSNSSSQSSSSNNNVDNIDDQVIYKCSGGYSCQAQVVEKLR